jgi:hypothetical protein
MSEVNDRLEIHELFARYGIAADTHNTEAWVALWTDNGVFDAGVVRFEGKKQLREFMSNHQAQTRHFITNVFADVSGDRATAEAYLLVMPTVGKPEVISTAHCSAELRKVEGRWKLARYTMRVDPSYVPPGQARPAS